jgi:hypothetical protein
MTREEAVRTEVAWIRTRARVVQIKREALAHAKAEHPGATKVTTEKPLSEHDRLRCVLLGMMGWKG